MSARLLAFVLLAACAGSAETAPSPEAADPEPTSDDVAGDEMRCLPLVSEACNCVFPCGVGIPREDGTLIVERSPWGTLPARVVRYCVPSDAHCTDVLSVNLACTVICAPDPADPTCGFIDGVCQSGAPTGGIGGVYEVHSGERQVGTLRLHPEDSPEFLGAGTYHYEGGPTDPAREFYFVTHPDGAYTFEGPQGDRFVGTLRFDPRGAGFGREDPRRSVLLRTEGNDATLRFHSLVSELETFRIERAPVVAAP